jgi:hypothetical protein
MARFLFGEAGGILLFATLYFYFVTLQFALF